MKRSFKKSVMFVLIVLALTFSAVGVTPAQAAATLTVTNTNDSGDGSLRATIASAGVGDTITFGLALSGGTIYLASTLILSQDVTIDGSALASQITISGDTAPADGTGDVRAFSVNSGVIAILNSLIITKGRDAFSGPGGGIENQGTLTVTNSTLSGNSTGSHGGGIDNFGTLTVTNSMLSGNSAGFGGGISNWNTLTVTNSTLSGNSAVDSDGGGILNYNGTLTVTNSTLSGNSAASHGGGISTNTASTLTVITNSALSDNSAIWGGGIYTKTNTGGTTVTNSTLSGNPANDGGGILNDTGGTLTVTNSTLSGNSATGWGGGISNYGGTLTVTNSTLSDNSANDGGGISNENDGINVGTLNYANTIIANSSSGGDCVNSSATLGTNANNLVEDSSCSASLNGDPKLGPLAHNGGSTLTFALLVGSSAIDAGNDLICAAAPVSNTSQNGVTRPQGAHCDIGAVEDTGAQITSSNTVSGTNPSATTGGSTGITANATGGGSVTVGIYNSNPGGTPSFSSSGAYVDVYVAPGNTFTSLTIVDCNLNGGTKVYWWNGTTWALASNQSYSSSTHCVTITVNNSTSPSLSQLTGTPFGAAADVFKLFLPLILR